MEKTELRIGNLVEYPNWNKDGTPAYFKIRDIYTDDGRIGLTNRVIQVPSTKIDRIKPIPLTKEWLLKLGFKDNTSTFNIVRASLSICGEYAKILYAKSVPYMVLDIGGNRIPLHHIKHVHELQNFYFSLTGEELT